MKKDTSSGFTLLEVLVALLVLSIGVLGIAKLQVVMLRSTNESKVSNQAAMLVQDMAERIRANRFGDYQIGILVPENCDSKGSALCRDDRFGSAESCDPDQMVAHDAKVWACTIQEKIPGARGSVTVQASGYRVAIAWSQLSIDGQSEEKSIETYVVP